MFLLSDIDVHVFISCIKTNNLPKINFVAWLQKYVSVVAFGEVGDAWGGTSNAVFSDPGRSLKLRTTYGLGVRLNTPLGPLRLDYGIGNGEDKGRFSFGFGASF